MLTVHLTSVRNISNCVYPGLLHCSAWAKRAHDEETETGLLWLPTVRNLKGQDRHTGFQQSSEHMTVPFAAMLGNDVVHVP